MEQAIKSLKAVYNRQYVSHAAARTKLIEALTFKQYQACRVNGFFLVERVSKVTRKPSLKRLASYVIYMADQLDETGRELDELLSA
jgi:hypothetical protein